MTQTKNNLAPEKSLAVLCRNLYLGADFTDLFPKEDNPRRNDRLEKIVEYFYKNVEATHYHERARSFAAEIAERHPHVVCMQEVYHYRFVDSATDEALDLDFLSILLDELARHHVHYRVANQAYATGVSLPIAWGEKQRQLHIQDSVVILVRSDINTLEEESARFGHVVTLPLPNKEHRECRPLVVRRAFGWVRIRWQDGTVRLVNTHLESLPIDDVPLKQAKQLISALSGVREPLVLAGDMNAGPEHARPVYEAFIKAGFNDPHPNGSYTFGAEADLRGPMKLTMRIDHIFTKGTLRAVGTERFGVEDKERTAPRKFWPSDHAGLLLRLDHSD